MKQCLSSSYVYPKVKHEKNNVEYLQEHPFKNFVLQVMQIHQK